MQKNKELQQETEVVLTEIIKILNSEKEFFYPVKKLWYELHNIMDNFKLSLNELKKLLQERKDIFRYYQFEDEIDEINEVRMREIGYWLGDRIMLVWRTPTKEELVNAMIDLLNKMISSLEFANDNCSEEDEEGRIHLIELIQRAREMKEKLEDGFLEQKK